MSLDGQTNTNVTSLQQEQQTTTVPVFNPSVVSRSYTNSQWTMKEDWYVDRVNKLTIPLSPTPADIANVANDLERLLVTARLDMSFIEQSYDKYELLYKIQEKIIYNDLYNYNVGVTQGQKLTVAEREGYVASIIKTATDASGSTIKASTAFVPTKANVVEKIEEEIYDNSEYSIAGDIIDLRDGFVTVKMGKPTAEELLALLEEVL